MEGAVFCSYWNIHLLQIQICFPACNASIKTTTCEITERLSTGNYPLMVLHTASLPTKEFTSQQMKCVNGSMSTEFTGLTMFPTVLKHLASEWWNGLFKTQLQCQLGGNTMEEWGKVLQEDVYMLSQHLIYPISRIHRTRNQGVEMGVALLYNGSPNHSLSLLVIQQKFCFLYSWLHALLV